MRRLLLLVTVIACLLPVVPVVPVAAAPTAPPRSEATPPSGFVDSLVTGGLSTPIAVTGLPDGRALVLQKGGQVRVISNGAVLPGAAISISVCTFSERGLLGVATDPGFGSNGYLYIYYTRASAGAPGGCVNRVSRYTMSGNTISAASQVVLLDNIGSPAGNHNGGDLEVGNDGFLYVAIGDGGTDPRGRAGANIAAQDLSLLNGKILRVDRNTGFAAPGNPLSGAGTADCRVRGNSPNTPITSCREIFAWGLRNPWRFAFDPNTGSTRFYINDVGQNAREEVNLGTWGANYGWPAREGVCPQGQQTPSCPEPDPGLGFTQPITDYSQIDGRTDFGGNYITGGAFVPDGAWSQVYDGGYLYADGGSGRMFHRPDVPPAVPNSVYGSPFATGASGISDMGFVMEPNGWALYYVLPGGQLRKIVYATAAAVLPTDAAAFFPDSYRAFDSRATGPTTGPLRAGTSRLIHVTEAINGFSYVLVNITMVRPTSDAFAVAWTPRRSRPPTSNINAPAAQVTANASIVPVDSSGNILIFTSATTHVLVDVLGGFGTASSNQSSSGRYQSVSPVRAADTRQPPNGTTNQYTRVANGPGDVVNVPIEELWGIPSNTTAVALVVTALSGSNTTSGYVGTFPQGQSSTQSSVNINGFGDIRANLVVVPVGADGSVDLRLRSVAHVIVDVVGSFTDTSAPISSGGMYIGVQPARVVDTRVSTGFAPPAGGTSSSVNPSTVPDGARGISQNIVMLRTSAHAYLTAYPAGLPAVPNVSNANATGPNQTRSAMAITSLGVGGGVSYYVSASTDMIVDVTGYFTAGPPG